MQAGAALQTVCRPAGVLIKTLCGQRRVGFNVHVLRVSVQTYV